MPPTPTSSSACSGADMPRRSGVLDGAYVPGSLRCRNSARAARGGDMDFASSSSSITGAAAAAAAAAAGAAAGRSQATRAPAPASAPASAPVPAPSSAPLAASALAMASARDGRASFTAAVAGASPLVSTADSARRSAAVCSDSGTSDGRLRPPRARGGSSSADAALLLPPPPPLPLATLPSRDRVTVGSAAWLATGDPSGMNGDCVPFAAAAAAAARSAADAR
eukprot:CAMPEP_0196788806 /NCGR_PEP_ID=MMETSP1104-20130614/25573_1 /TAXON_ID=33652 /ORGANISM="Cafeteria sp., Strain Caron Lab Isolate" /LENGTH=223 /DNA_ID=CAMNT_0042159153 /DNA_START=8 /DNA_END=675 /DNA_ORIENTATION=-